MTQQVLDTSNATYVKKSGIIPNNLVTGCAVYENDLHVGDEDYYIFIPYGSDGEPVVSERVGYTLLWTHTFKQGIFPNLDALIEIVGYSPMTFTELKNHPDFNSKLFFNLLTENSMKAILSYLNALSGKCLDGTRKYCNIIPEPEGVGAAEIGSTFIIG